MATPKKVVRIRAPRPEKIPDLMHEGDLIEFSLTAEVRHPKRGSYWIKGGGTTQVRPGETANAARERLHSFVKESVDETVLEVLSDE